MGGKSGQILHKTTVSPLDSSWLVNGLFTFSGGGCMDASYWAGSASWAW